MNARAQSLLPVLARLSSTPLLIRPDGRDLISALALRSMQLHNHPRADSTDGGPDGDESMPWEDYEAVQIFPGGVAVVPVRGVICAGVDAFTAWAWGLCRPEAVMDSCARLAADPATRIVVFDFMSPGGWTTMVPETAAAIAALTARKSTLAWMPECCSAAYWWASQCEKTAALGSGTVGSVGTYATVYDLSKMFQEAGITAHLIAAGEFKGQGTPGVPVSEKFLALVQANVDRINAKFLATVRAGRGQLADEDLQGQWFDGEQAVEKNLADVTADSLVELMARLIQPDLAALS